MTVTTGTKAQVSISAGIYLGSGTQRVSVAVSGATTIAASDDWSIRQDSSSFNGLQGITFIMTGLTPGSNTFSLVAKTAAGTSHIFERRISVTPV